MHRTALLASLLATTAVADTNTPGHQADLFFGPLIGGEDMVLQVNSTETGAPTLAFFAFGFAPTVPANPAFPVISVSPANTFLSLLTDANGQARVEIPTVPGQFPAGTGLVMRMQAVLFTGAGTWVTSQVKSTELEPIAPPAPGFLVDEAATRLPAGFDTLGAIEASAVDFNRDGYLDLTVLTEFDIRQWENDGSGAFLDVTASAISHPGDALFSLAHGDVNGDGFPDLVTGGAFDGAAGSPDRLYLNTGAGGFAAAAYPAGDGTTFDLELGDVDNDGDLDVVHGFQPDFGIAIPGGTDQIYVNDGTGGFAADAAFAAMAWNEPLTDTRGIELGDMDRDGDLDIFVAKSDTGGSIGSSGERNRLLLGDGAGGFTDATLTNLPALSENSQDVELADLDGDGDLDVLTANSVFSVPTANSGDVLINLGGLQGGVEGTFADNPLSFLEPSTSDNSIRMSIHAADLEADGDLDVLCTVHDGFFNGTQQLLFMNNGGSQGGAEGFFTQDLVFDPADAIISGAALFDADGDGDIDIFLPVNGVISGDPAQGVRARLMINAYL